MIAASRGRGTGGAACLALLALLVTAAGSSSAAGRSPASTPASTHTYVDLVPALPANLDESATPDAAQSAIVASWSSELVRPRGAPPGPHATLPAADDVVPYLATSWTAGPHGDYTFHLRRGVRSPSGDPFTATDVRWSIRRALAVSPVAPFLLSLANVDPRNPVTILGPFTVRVNVTAPSPFLLAALSWFDEGIYDRNAYLAHASGDDPWAVHWGETHSVTFGAYALSRFTASRAIVLRANPGSWVHPYYTTVEIKQMSSSGDRLRHLLDGSADHTSGLDWSDFGSAGQYAPVDHLSVGILQDGPTVESWLLNLRGSPLSRRDVREALNLAINRSELSGAVYAGYAAPDVLAVPAIDGQPQPSAFDPARARALLARAGYPHGLTLQVDLPTDVGDGSESFEIHVLTEQLAQVGITLVPMVLSNEDQLLELEQTHQLQSTIEDISPILGGAAFLLIQDDDGALDPVSPAADDGYASPQLAALLARVRSAPASPASTRLIARAAGLIESDLPMINLLALPVENISRAGIAGYAAYTVPVTYYELLHPSGR